MTVTGRCTHPAQLFSKIGLVETNLQLYPSGCLFMVARSGILKRTFPVAINRIEAAVNQDLKVLNPFVKGMERYLQIMFNGLTDFILSDLVKTGTTVQSLKYEEFVSQAFPLPPLPEQNRIIAKVQELMALCDRLEAAQGERESRRDQFTASVHHHLSNGADAEATRIHARFFINHLSRLTARPDQIKQLRQTILDLAVRGHLVPQNPKDDSTITSIRHMLPSFADRDQLTPNDCGGVRWLGCGSTKSAIHFPLIQAQPF